MSTPDPIDQLGARLFQAAREERLPEGALARVLAAARDSRSAPAAQVRRVRRPVQWSLWAAAAAIAAGAVVFTERRETSERISAEPSSSRRYGAEKTAPSAPVLAPTPVTSLGSSAKPVPSVSAPTPVHSARVSLGDELDALKVASSALAAGDSNSALAALDQYDQVLKGKKMRAEATLLRIEALSRSGQAGAASALAQQFVQKNPESPLVDRARTFVSQ